MEILCVLTWLLVAEIPLIIGIFYIKGDRPGRE